MIELTPVSGFVATAYKNPACPFSARYVAIASMRKQFERERRRIDGNRVFWEPDG